jgi:predicted glycoside hydrolase/deacetylase ChbG (UPF0249 family)
LRIVYINADDFGWTDGHNQAVEQAHKFGVLNRTSLLCNGQAFDQAVQIAQELPNLQVGIHLTLNEGNPLAPPADLPGLLNGGNEFPDSLKELADLWLRGRLSKAEVCREWCAQIERGLNAGIHPSHLDSHKHVHLFPPLLDVAIQLAGEYQISYLRLPKENSAAAITRRGPLGLMLWLLAVRAQRVMSRAGVSFSHKFVGVGSSGAMTADKLAQALRGAIEGITEIMTHPAVITSAVADLQHRYQWAANYQFEEELNALCSPEVAALV